MYRTALKHLESWRTEIGRQPLLLKGPRQVGKSYLIEQLFGKTFENVVSVNFERSPDFKACFKGELDPRKITLNIKAISGKEIEPGKTLLFLDEIQACPEAIVSLRYFCEELPQLHVIAAGSLIQFALDEVSVPVGRITYRWLGPLSFEEFLINSGNGAIADHIRSHDATTPIAEAVHQKGLALFHEFLLIGGMPAAVRSYIENGDIRKYEEIQSDILQGYRDDLPKYARYDRELDAIDSVFAELPKLAARQFKYVHISRDLAPRQIRKCINKLAKAGVVNKVLRSNQVPLGVSSDPDRFKLNFIDVGLVNRSLRVDVAEWMKNPITLINKGSLAEQFAGQELLAHGNFRESELYYWERDQRGSTAEIDYLLQLRTRIIPVEIKSGSTGRLGSLKVFLHENPDIKFGIKVSHDNFTFQGRMLSIPFYAFGIWYSGILNKQIKLPSSIP